MRCFERSYRTLWYKNIILKKIPVIIHRNSISKNTNFSTFSNRSLQPLLHNDKIIIPPITLVRRYYNGSTEAATATGATTTATAAINFWVSANLTFIYDSTDGPQYQHYACSITFNQIIRVRIPPHICSLRQQWRKWINHVPRNHSPTIFPTNEFCWPNGSSKRHRSNAHPLHALSTTSLQNGVLPKTDQKPLGTRWSRVLFPSVDHAYCLEYSIWVGISCGVIFSNFRICNEKCVDSLVGVWGGDGKCGETDCQWTFDDCREEYEPCPTEGGMAVCFWYSLQCICATFCSFV